MSCRRKPLDQGQDAPVADRVRHPADQPVVRDRVEIALQVGIHHEAVACLQKPIDLPQRRLAAASRTEAVAARPELRFKDWFNGQFERRLHHPVPGFRSGQALDRRDAQRAGLAVPLGYLDPFHRSRPIAAVLQLLVKLRQIPLRLRREPFDALSINPRRPLVPLDSRPSGRQGRRPIDLVYQTEPLASPRVRPAAGPRPCFDAVDQRRHHALRPDRGFRPPPLPAAGFCPLRSLIGTAGTRLPRFGHRTSNSLPPFPRGGFATRSLHRARRHRYYKGSDPAALTRTTGLSAYPVLPSRHSAPNHAIRPMAALPVVSAPSAIPGFAVIQQARHGFTPKRVRPPADWRFASGCSPPRLTATQFPSASKPRHTSTGTPTLLTRRPHGRTGYAGQARSRGSGVVLGLLQTTNCAQPDSRGSRLGMDEVGLLRVHYLIESEH